MLRGMLVGIGRDASAQDPVVAPAGTVLRVRFSQSSKLSAACPETGLAETADLSDGGRIKETT